MFSNTHLKNGVCLPAAVGAGKGLCALLEHLQGWQVSQANRADVFSATPVFHTHFIGLITLKNEYLSMY